MEETKNIDDVLKQVVELAKLEMLLETMVGDHGADEVENVVKQYVTRPKLPLTVFTINLIDEGFLKDSFMSADRQLIHDKVQELHEIYYNEYNEDGYIAIEQGTIGGKFRPNIRLVQINLDDPKEELVIAMEEFRTEKDPNEMKTSTGE